MALAGKRFRVSGRVQGVGYRYYCLKQANALSICGSAENKDDGSVEVIAVGEENSLVSYLGALRDGPDYARVESVESAVLEQGELERIFGGGGFTIE